MQEKIKLFPRIKFPSWRREYYGVGEKAFSCFRHIIINRSVVLETYIAEQLIKTEKVFNFLDDVIFLHASAEAAGLESDLIECAECTLSLLRVLLGILHNPEGIVWTTDVKEILAVFTELFRRLLRLNNTTDTIVPSLRMAERDLLHYQSTRKAKTNG